MNDMTGAIVPKSDQLNADDLIGRELTIKITGVAIKGGQEQPVSIHFEGDDGKPYKPCKSMSRILVSAWGPDSSKYVGRSMTLYRDPKVKWAGMDVGGIRISHMSDIADDLTMALTVTRANKKPFTVRPLRAASGAKAKESKQPEGGSTPDSRREQGALGSGSEATGGAVSPGTEYITPDQCLTLEVACNDNGIQLAKLKAAAKVERLAQIKAADYDRAMQWIDKAKAAKEVM